MERHEHEGEKALVAKATLKGDKSDDPLAEINALAATAGAEVVDSVVQNLSRPQPGTYMGRGKVGEVASRANELDVDVVIADNELSPAQERNLEKATSRKVVDRTQLIMDIFSQRARSRQAKLQVELAQLRYSLPRLKRMWTHLDRFKAGIGMRGPGEMQLEEDKRLIGRRIQKLKHELRKLEDKRHASTMRRSNEFVVALVGYTNAGKSTLLNRLTDSEELVEDKLFATLDTRVRQWPLNDKRYVLASDTVGFIRNLPHHLVASFHATLSEVKEADLLLHVIDAGSIEASQHMDVVRDVLRRLECQDTETWLVFNKWDSVPEERLIEARHLAEKKLKNERVLRLSAHTGEGIDTLTEAVLDRLQQDDCDVELDVPHQRGDVISYIQDNGQVRSVEYETSGVAIKASLSPTRLAKLKAIYPEGFPPPTKEVWEE